MRSIGYSGVSLSFTLRNYIARVFLSTKFHSSEGVFTNNVNVEKNNMNELKNGLVFLTKIIEVLHQGFRFTAVSHTSLLIS